ncbi:MAG: tRNA (adenosine(37)-N6)-threonylcarbamoyltransferase complex ATPase subunit type 1 TsaE [Arenibacterium sp.]
MPATRFDIITHSPDETAGFAAKIAQSLCPGDTILLSGPIGAGKSHFCRHLIQSRLVTLEDVPSPTFTLVQIYEVGDAEIWHSDLYRLTNTLEVEELGLFDAFETAICLVEWPDRLGDDAPETALAVSIETFDTALEKRRFALTWTDPKWRDRLKELIDD